MTGLERGVEKFYAKIRGRGDNFGGFSDIFFGQTQYQDNFGEIIYGMNIAGIAFPVENGFDWIFSHVFYLRMNSKSIIK